MRPAASRRPCTAWPWNGPARRPPAWRRPAPAARRGSAGSCAPPRPTCPATCSRCSRSTSASRLYRAEARTTHRLPAVCPFLGLASFDAAHADFFFGRERLVAELVARMVGSPLLALVGPSGRRQVLGTARRACCRRSRVACCPAPSGASQALMRPGAHPLAELERALPARRRRGPRRRPVRGAVHGLPRRTGARRVPRHARRAGDGRRSPRPGRASPCAPTSTGAAPRTSGSRGSSARTRCSSGR